MSSTLHRVIETLREIQPLEHALAGAARLLCAELGAHGVEISVRYEGRTVRADAGHIGAEPHTYPLDDRHVRGELAVSEPRHDPGTWPAIVTLALVARFLAQSAHTDALTGVANRRTFDDRLAEEWRRARRNDDPLSLAILDLDYFKEYNDEHGHPAGDDVLRRVARAAESTLRGAGDRFARYGGEEFGAILPRTDLPGAIASAERMREAVEALDIRHAAGKSGRLTISVGVAVAHPARGGTMAALVSAADAELYRAKAQGRDRVCADGYAVVASERDELPRPLSTLVGRDADIAELCAALQRHRVVTITGPAGIGKTRLALAVAHECGDTFGRVSFVDVLGVTAFSELMRRIGASLGFDAESDVEAALAGVTEPTLLVIDGCEGFAQGEVAGLDGVDLPAVRFLITSRVALGIRGEFVYCVPTLDDAAARALFADRIAAAGVTVATRDNDVAALLHKLEGSPLEIEIAAHRLRRTSAREVLAALQPAPNGAGDRIGLQSLVDHAVSALDAVQSAVLTAVSSFHGTFTVRDAAAVAGGLGLDERRVDDVLRAIASGSMLSATSHDGITRWYVIAPIRQAARSRPGADIIRRAADAAHVRWCRARLDAIAQDAGTGFSRRGLIESELIIAEVRTALDRALADSAMLSDAAELCIAAVRQWYGVRDSGEGRRRCEAVLAQGIGLDPIVAARLQTAAARLAFLEGDFDATEKHAAAAAVLLGDRDVEERSPALNYLGVVAKFRGDLDRAERIFEEGRAMNVRIGNARGQAIAIGALGSIALEARLDFDRAVELYREAAAMFRVRGEDLQALVMQGHLVEALCARGDLDDAAQLARTGLDEVRAFGDRATLGHLLAVSGLCAQLRGDVRVAAEHAIELFSLIARATLVPLVGTSLDLGGRIVLPARQAELTVLLGGAAAAYALPSLPIARFWREPVLARAREELGEQRYGDCLTKGQRMPLEEAVARAVSGLEALAATRAAATYP